MFTRNLKLAAFSVIAAATLTSCNAQKNDLPSFAPATRIVVTDYTAITTKNPGAVTSWQVTKASKIARLTRLANAQRQGWSDIGTANLTTRTGIEMKFTGPGVNQILTLYPRGFDDSYGTAKGNLWSREDRVGPVTQRKLISDAALAQFIADVRAVLKNVQPSATPAIAATPKVSP